MSRLRSQIERLRDDAAGSPTAWVVWHQDVLGADAFTSSSAQGVTLTGVELAAYRDAPGVGRIVVCRE